MATIYADELSVCTDCTMLIANGEVTDGDGNDIAAEVAARQVERWGDRAAYLVLSCPEGCEGWFSWSPCDGCGSTLGGDRHPAVVFDS